MLGGSSPPESSSLPSSPQPAGSSRRATTCTCRTRRSRSRRRSRSKARRPPPDRGGILYVDLVVRRATWPERLLPFVRPEGSTLVPEHDVVPRGSSFTERRQDARAQMNRSELVAAAVALRQAGFPVRAVPRGILIEGVAPDAPAATKLEAQDVIVAVDGRKVPDPGRVARARGPARARRERHADAPPRRQAPGRNRSDRARPCEPAVR